MKDSAILLIVLVCSVIAPSFCKTTKKHPILQRRSLISLKEDFITPINANSNSTIAKRDNIQKSNVTTQKVPEKKEQIIYDRVSPYFGPNLFLAPPNKPINKNPQFDMKGFNKQPFYPNRHYYTPKPLHKNPLLKNAPLKPPTIIKTLSKPKLSLAASIMNKINSNRLRKH